MTCYTLQMKQIKFVTFAVKTTTGLIEYRTIRNKIMQGDVLSPLMSSNFVDTNIGKIAVSTGNTYLYKTKVEIPPLMMQYDTFAVSVCGFKTTKMNNFINTWTNILGLQFGRDKCVQMHIGKSYNPDICTPCEVDAWDEIVKTEHGNNHIEDQYIGVEAMKNVHEKNI